MKHSSDKMYEKFKDFDFADAKPVAHTTHLTKLQAKAGGKSRITMRVDSDIVAIFEELQSSGSLCYDNLPYIWHL